MAKINEETQERITCEAVFSEWTEDHLVILADEKDIESEYTPKQLRRLNVTLKEKLVEDISFFTRKTGLKLLMNDLNKELLEELAFGLDKSFLTKNNNSMNKSVYAKRLYEAMNMIGGFMPYLEENIEDILEEFPHTLDHILKYFGEAPVSRKLHKVLLQICEAVETVYLRNILAACPVQYLRAVCATMRIKPRNCKSSIGIANCIITGEHYEPPSYKFGFIIPTALKKPKRFTSELTLGDLQYWFTASELKNYCDKQGIKNVGKKSEVATRIKNYLDPDFENKDPLMKGYTKSKNTGGRKKKASRTLEAEPLQDRRHKKREKMPIIESEPMGMDISSEISSDDWMSEG